MDREGREVVVWTQRGRRGECVCARTVGFWEQCASLDQGTNGLLDMRSRSGMPWVFGGEAGGGWLFVNTKIIIHSFQPCRPLAGVVRQG